MISLVPYDNIFFNHTNLPDQVTLEDHLCGFDQSHHNTLLSHIDTVAARQHKQIQVNYHQILESSVTKKYSNLDIKFQLPHHVKQMLWQSFADYNIHPSLDFKNFICSFNGTPHVGRKLLVSALKKFNYFDPAYCSKNFSLTSDILDGHISDFVGKRSSFYNKFFAVDDSDFLNSEVGFKYTQYDHKNNIYNLESRLTNSFLHIVSESLATSYVPFVTEKFLYSVVTRGLFLAYAQPGWHLHVEKYYGFRRYTQLFDYQFDTIQNPVHRLIELLTMLSKFDKLTPAEWHDLYLMESDTIEFNYDWYFSNSHIKQLEAFAV
jgi:hypothetical protein